jgi:hypothetical protein
MALSKLQIDLAAGGSSRPALSPRGVGSLAPCAPMGDGYQEAEYLIKGAAKTYSGPATGPARETGTDHRFTTRLITRYPRDPDLFSGRVILEPFNTSRNGIDSDVVWEQVATLLQSNGDAWIGVTVRSSAGDALRASDRERYAEIDLAMNDLEWDILRQVGLLTKGSDGAALIGGNVVAHLYMAGYSQSAVDTATFAMALHDLSRTSDGLSVFDGYFPAAHSGSLTPLESGDSPLPQFEHAPMAPVSVPVVNVETQTDIEGFEVALSPGVGYRSIGGAHLRRPDSDAPGDLYRLYEIAGAPHVGVDPECGSSSSFPTEAFLRAGLIRLIRWAEDGVAPPSSSRIELAVAGEVSEAAVDGVGNAIGGVRSPFVDVPLSNYKVHAESGGMFMLTGDERPLPRHVLVQRYETEENYMEQFTASLDEAIAAGFLLQMDREFLLAARASQAHEAFRQVN